MELFKFSFLAMGCQCEIQLASIDKTSAGKTVRLAIDEVLRIEFKYSRYRRDSVVSRINSAAGTGKLVSCDDETLWLLDYASTLFESSDGLFDITSGVLRHVWDFKKQRIPDNDELQSALELVGWNKVEGGKGGIGLPVVGMEIDFGGFGKEYAADQATSILASVGVHHAYVNLGGDIRVIGPQPDGMPWVVGIKHPRETDRIVATFPLELGALATSGDYEKYFEIEGNRYCHILNPVTGHPVNHWRSVSVVAPLAIAAGSYSTIAMLKGADGIDFLDSIGFQYFCIDSTGKQISKNAKR
jgi:thiamine biosynthesis lipoprotein